MKKLLIALAFLLFTGNAFAQGGLCIDNSMDKCGVWVKMVAMDNGSGYPLCSINSVTFYVPALTTMCWPNVWAFQTSPGWMTPTIIPAASLTFVWTDVTFQFDCPYPGCAGGGNLSNGCGPTCWGAPPAWASPCHMATWMPVCLPLMGNLTIKFT